MRRLWYLAFLFIILPVFTTAQVSLDPADQRALRELEKQVTDLKKDVHTSKLRMHALKEAVLRGKIAGSKAHVLFDNQAEGFFAFDSAEFFLNDDPIMKVDGAGRKTPLETLEVYDQDLPPGEHKLHAKIRYRGNERAIHSAFGYFKDHQFLIETTESFPVEYGKTTLIKLTALDQGYFKSDISERLRLQFQVLRNWGSTLP